MREVRLEVLPQIAQGPRLDASGFGPHAPEVTRHQKLVDVSDGARRVARHVDILRHLHSPRGWGGMPPLDHEPRGGGELCQDGEGRSTRAVGKGAEFPRALRRHKHVKHRNSDREPLGSRPEQDQRRQVRREGVEFRAGASGCARELRQDRERSSG